MSIRKYPNKDGTYTANFKEIYRNKSLEIVDIRNKHYAVILDFFRGIRTEGGFLSKLDSSIIREVLAYEIENYDSTAFEPNSAVKIKPIREKGLVERVLRQKLIEDGIILEKKTNREEDEPIKQESFYFQRQLDGSIAGDTRGENLQRQRGVDFAPFFQCNAGTDDDKDN